MKPQPQDTGIRQCVRFDGPPELLLLSMTCETPLYIHAGNWMAGLCAVTPLREMIGNHTGTRVFFPEDGLQVSLEDIEAIHGIDLETGEDSTLSVEFAIQGLPRAISIAALPNLSDAPRFRRSLRHQRAAVLTNDEYQQWSDSHTRRPAMCPCCAASAEQRRAAPQHNPLSRIFRHAIQHAVPLRCGIVSPAYGFTAWLTPGAIDFDDGRIELTGTDGMSMLEFDPGACHSLAVIRERLDDEPFTIMRLFDSTGNLRLEIGTPGWEAESTWRELCEVTA
jgi:hypothetical protein